MDDVQGENLDYEFINFDFEKQIKSGKIYIDYLNVKKRGVDIYGGIEN